VISRRCFSSASTCTLTCRSRPSLCAYMVDSGDTLHARARADRGGDGQAVRVEGFVIAWGSEQPEDHPTRSADLHPSISDAELSNVRHAWLGYPTLLRTLRCCMHCRSASNNNRTACRSPRHRVFCWQSCWWDNLDAVCQWKLAA